MLASLRRGTFVRGVAVLVGGAAGAQAVNAIAAPFLTRLYTPSDIGVLGLFAAFLSVGSITLSLRYDQAVVVPSDAAVAGRLARIALVALVPMTLLVTAVLVGLVMTDTVGYGALPEWAILVAGVSMLVVGLTSVLRHWLIRTGRFDVIAGVLVGQGMGRAASQVGFGVLGLGLPGLLVGDALGRLVGVARMLRTTWTGLSESTRRPTTSTTVQIGAEYRQFPLAGVPSSLLNALAFQLPTPLLATAYGLPVAGFFSLVQRVLGVPLTVVGASVADVLLGRMSEHARNSPGHAERLFRRTALGLLALAFPIALIVVLIGPSAFELLFGVEWRPAGLIAAVMAPWYIAALVVSPLSRVVVVYRGQVSKLVYDVISLGVAVGSISWASAQGVGPVTAVWYLSLGQAAAYCVYLGILYRLVRRGARLDPATGRTG
jgi:O-antigen/teichoic acid export membrane protein